jgi:hypothetical protein
VFVHGKPIQPGKVFVGKPTLDEGHSKGALLVWTPTLFTNIKLGGERFSMDKHSWLFGLFVTTKGGVTKLAILIFPELELINAELNHLESLGFSSAGACTIKLFTTVIYRFL